MTFSRRVEERRQEREEKRRQAELIRRQEQDRQRQKEAESRAQALEEARQRDAAWEAARVQRQVQQEMIRSRKRDERRAVEREIQQRQEQIDQIRITKRQERQLLQEDLARQLALREQQLEARQAERQEIEKAAARDAENAAAQRQAAHEAARQERLEERANQVQEAERNQAVLEESRQTRREEQRQAEKRGAAIEAARQAKLEEQQAFARDAESAAAQRQAILEAARQERLDERANQMRQAEKRGAAIEAARQAKLEEQQASARDAENAAVQRQAALEAARQEQLAERVNQAQEAERRQAVLEESRQARLAEKRQAEKIAASRLAARADARNRRQVERRQEERFSSRLAAQRVEKNQSRPNLQNPSGQKDGNPSNPASSSTQPSEPRHPFQDPIPSGRISGALPWLRVSANRITNIFGDPIQLRGVSLLGLDGAEPHPQLGFAAGAGIDSLTIDNVLSWGANLLCVAVNRSRVLNGYGDWSAWDYLADLDEIIRQAAAAGAYTLLSLRRLDDVTIFGTLPGPDGERLPNYIAPMPDYDSIGMWRLLGERYASEPAVLFDLYTAPHPPLEDDLSGFTTDWDLWMLWVQVITADLRRLHPRALIFVSGLDGGTDLSGFPILGTAGQPIPNLVYTAHLYPRRTSPLTAMQTLGRSHPVFISEWGGSSTDLLWGERTELALRSQGFGWTAAFWNTEPALTQSVNGQITPTPFGALVRRALAVTGEPLAASQPAVPPILSGLTFG